MTLRKIRFWTPLGMLFLLALAWAAPAQANFAVCNKSDQAVRGSVVMPAGTGKKVRIAVFTQGEKADAARAAGADIVGLEDLAEKVKAGQVDFDVAIASPDAMRVVGQLGQILGPRGLMPNPKTGTVTFDIGKAVTDIKGGRVEYKTDTTGIVHLIIGKRSFGEQQLLENLQAAYEEIVRARPSSAKGKYLISASISSTMSPGVRIDASGLRSVEVASA